MITEVPDNSVSARGKGLPPIDAKVSPPKSKGGDHKYSLARSVETLYRSHLLSSGSDRAQELSERKHLYMHHEEHSPEEQNFRNHTPLPAIKSKFYDGSILKEFAFEKTAEQSGKIRREWALENRDKPVKSQIEEAVGYLNYPDGFFVSSETDKYGELTCTNSGYPGGLSMSSSLSNKYFGAEARLQFFERQKWITRQRSICTTSQTVKASSLPLQQEYELNITSEEADYPFRPIRKMIPLKISSKVLIRTQILSEGGNCESQIKLVAKPFSSVSSAMSATSSITSASPIDSARSSVAAEGLNTAHITNDGNAPSSAKSAVTAHSKTASITSKNTQTNTKASRPLVFDTSVASSSSSKPHAKSSPSTASNTQPAQTPKLVQFSPASNELKPVDISSVKSTVKKSKDKPHIGEVQPALSPAMETTDNNEKATAPKKHPVPHVRMEEIREDAEYSENAASSIQLVCIDYRDKFNKKVHDSLQKNSLFQYVQSKKASHDFKDEDSGSDNDSIDDEISSIMSTNLFPTKGSSSSGSSSSSSTADALSGQGDRPSVPEEEVQLSPRSSYIDSCIRKKLNPHLSLILRKNFSKILSLQHHGMGDDMAILFAEAIEGIPYIQSLNVADNHLTDKGLGPLVLAATGMKELIDLNISYNKIDSEASACLSTYLARSDCPLKRFILRRADVDDGEGANFVHALLTNTTLTELDMSENLLGSHEQLNTVMSDITTGGEALAELLSSEKCVLRVLKLGWNMIRLGSGIQLCQSLSVNKTLTYLDLSFNALGCEGGMTLGSALQDNHTLQTLLVANNALDSRACISICAGILQNECLERIVLDGNPIGEEGAKALMLLPTMVGSRVEISASSCNIRIRDIHCKYDLGNILRSYELKLDDPFSRAIAIFVVRLVAVHQSYFIARSDYIDETGKSQNIDLIEKVVVDSDSKRLDKLQKQKAINLKLGIESSKNVNKALQLFNEIDRDGSGKLDEQELAQLVESLGLEMSEESLMETMHEYDMDEDGNIELEDFLQFMRNQSKELTLKLKELIEFPIICMRESTILEQYMPPRCGILKLQVVDGFTQKPTYRVISDSDRKCIDLLASQSGDVVTMTAYGVQSYKIRLHEAIGVVNSMLKETSNKTVVLSRVLPQVASPEEARKLLSKTMKNSKTEIARSRRDLGNLSRPILGCPDGFYVLDLSDASDRQCLTRLVEISKTRAHFRGLKSPLGYGVVGDCSQKGKWSCFRNELYRGKPMEVTSEFASPMPKNGKIEFDYVSEKRYKKDEIVLKDGRVVAILIQFYLLRIADKKKALKRLQRSVVHTDRTVNGDGKTDFECSMRRAREIGEHMNHFYENLPLRQSQLEALKGLEKITHYEGIDERIADLEAANNFTHKSAASLMPFMLLDDIQVVNNNDAVSSSSGRRPVEKPDQFIPKVKPIVVKDLSSDHSEDLFNEDDNNNNSDYSEEDSEQDEPDDLSLKSQTSGVQSVVSNAPSESSHTPIATAMPSPHRHKIDEWTLRYIRVAGSKNNSANAKAAKILEILLEQFEFTFIMARHLELILDLFQEFGLTRATDFGTYRVELVVGLFGCVVDLHNFEIVMRALTPFEAACVYCRVGWLHIYNPMKPQGAYELDLSRREERLLLKTLTTLTTHEPGDTFREVNFRWERHMDPMPGFELTVPWLTEEGLPQKGLFNVYYFGIDHGKKNKNFQPLVKLRKSMLHLVLLNEEEVLTDADIQKEGHTMKLVGEEYMKANLGSWYGYFTYNEEEYLKIKSAKDSAAGKDKKKKRK